jgi:hypothetical protein
MIVLPYTQVNGSWTLPDQAMVEIFLKMQQEDKLDRVFYMGEIRNPAQFVAMMKNPRNVVHTVWDDKQFMAIVWLNDIGRAHAFAHFCMFKESQGKTKEVADASFLHWFSMKKPDGSKMFNAILGRTPATNKPATGFLKKIGMTILGTVPGICWNDYTQQYDDAVFSYMENNHG